MLDQVEVQGVDEVAVVANEAIEHWVRSFRGEFRRNEPEPPADTMNVRVDWHRGAAKAEEQDAGGGLWADSGETKKPGARLFEGNGTKVTERVLADFVRDSTQNRLNAGRFDIGQTSHPDGLGHFICRCGSNFGPVREAISKRGKCASRIDIRGVLGEDRGDELGEWIGMGMPAGTTVLLREE